MSGMLLVYACICVRVKYGVVMHVVMRYDVNYGMFFLCGFNLMVLVYIWVAIYYYDFCLLKYKYKLLPRSTLL